MSSCNGSSTQFPAESNTRSSNSSRRQSSFPFSSMLGQRHDLGRVQNRGVEAVFDRVVQVHAVEHLPRVRREAERAVREAEVRERPGQVLLDEPDAASNVAMALLRVCSCPVDSGNTSVSNIRSLGGMPYSFTTMS